MKIVVIGVDPGASGAIAVVDSDERIVSIVRLAGRERHDHGIVLGGIVRDQEECAVAVVIEEVTYGSRLCESYGILLGAARAVCAPLSIDVHTVTARSWQRAIGAGPTRRAGFYDAAAGRERKRLLAKIAREQWPDDRLPMAACDAPLIALAYLRSLSQTKST